MAGGATSYEDEDGGGGVITDINVTPLVDITLVLLIIFMVTARLIVSRAIPVDSPKAVSGEQVKTTLALTMDKTGKLYLNGDYQPNRVIVAEYVRRSVASNPEIQAVITADKAVPHGDVMELIDMVKIAGVKKFALTVEEKVER
jgi:biopolymer transport protein ExbD